MHYRDTGAIVDQRHLEAISRLSWNISPSGYAVHYACSPETHKTRYMFSMHRKVWELEYGIPAPRLLDHINRNKLDNRIENLRPATETLNSLNSRHRKFKHNLPTGVDCVRGRMIARITYRSRTYSLGGFATPAEASACYERHREILMAYEAALANGKDVPPPEFMSPKSRRRGRPKLSRSLVLQLIEQGLTRRQIAERLSVSRETIKNCEKDLGVCFPQRRGRPRRSSSSPSVGSPRT